MSADSMECECDSDGGELASDDPADVVRSIRGMLGSASLQVKLHLVHDDAGIGERVENSVGIPEA